MSEQQHALVSILAPLDVADTQRACHVWNLHATALIDTPPPAERERVLRFGADSTGAVVGNFVLTGATAATPTTTTSCCCAAATTTSTNMN